MSATWTIENNRLTHENLPEPLSSVMSEPYPPFWWYIENDILEHHYLPEPIYQGSFCNCTNLKTVIIPATVKYIGDYAFYNTALTSVTIASDCVFSDTSFPPRCIINYYLE